MFSLHCEQFGLPWHYSDTDQGCWLMFVLMFARKVPHSRLTPSECPGLSCARGSVDHQVFQRSGWPGSPHPPGPGFGSGLGRTLPGGRPRREQPIPAPAWPASTLPLAPVLRVQLDSLSSTCPALQTLALSFSGCHPAPQITSTAPGNTWPSGPVPSQCTPGWGLERERKRKRKDFRLSGRRHLEAVMYPYDYVCPAKQSGR